MEIPKIAFILGANNFNFNRVRGYPNDIQGGADKLGLFLNSITGVNKHLELCNFDCAFVYAPRIR